MKSLKTEMIKTVLLVLCTLAYFFSPVDIIPDWFFGFGQADDLAIITFTVMRVMSFLKYKKQVEGKDIPQNKKDANTIFINDDEFKEVDED